MSICITSGRVPWVCLRANFGEFRPFLSVLARISGLTFSLGTLCQSPLGLGGLWLRFGAVLGVFDPSKRL